jgi:hypothetical protein
MGGGSGGSGSGGRSGGGGGGTPSEQLEATIKTLEAERDSLRENGALPRDPEKVSRYEALNSKLYDLRMMRDNPEDAARIIREVNETKALRDAIRTPYRETAVAKRRRLAQDNPL